MTYNYTLAELSALGVTDLTITYRSMAADTASLRCPMVRATAAALPWVTGDRIIISDERVSSTPRIFSGKVKTLTTALNGGEYAVQIELANDVDILNATTYAYIGEDGIESFGQSFYIDRAKGESRDGERLTSCRRVCESCCSWAHTSCSHDVQFDATIMGIAGTGSQSCWSLILAALRWVPDAGTAMRYSASGDVLTFLTARDMSPATINTTTGNVTDGEGNVLVRFNRVTDCALTPRPDLIPPCCALTGRKKLKLPADGDTHAPGAFIYHVRERDANTTKAQKEATRAVRRMAPYQVVRGRLAPINMQTAIGAVEMKKQTTLTPADLLKFWSGFSSFSLLKKYGAGALMFGNPLFEPVPVEDAYGTGSLPDDNTSDNTTDTGDDSGSSDLDGSLDPDAEDEAVPANYEEPLDWNKIYLLTEGSFPASVEKSRNLSGLKWCRGKLSQYVWLRPGTAKPADTSAEKVDEFFCGSTKYKGDDGQKQSVRYALLTVEGIWINLRTKRYQEGTNEEDTPTDDESDDEDATSSEKDPDYGAALRTFYYATRKLYHDGSITLFGVQGNPGDLLCTGINITGLLPEWEGMKTPCNEISYDPIARQATLTLGSREVLSMDELLERQRIGMYQAESRRNGTAQNPQDETPDEDSEDEEEETDDSTEMIAPTINAALGANTAGKPLNPFQIYQEGDKYIMNGGPLPTPHGIIDVEDTEITGWVKGRKYYVKAVWDRTNKTWKPKLLYREPKES